MDGHLVEPLDLDVDATSQKKKKKQMGSEQPSRKRPRSESNPKDGNEGNLHSAMETSRKGKEKVTESLHLSDVDIAAEERKSLKIGVKASRLEMDPPLSTPTGQTSNRGNNHIPAGDTTKEVPPTSSKLSSNGIMEESVSQMTTMLSNILEHHGCANQRLASLEKDLVHTKIVEEKQKGTIEALEKEKSEMNAKVALMERKDLYELLEANMEGFQIANHLGTIEGFKNLNLTIMRKWAEIPALNLEEFEKCPADYPEHRTLQDEVDQTVIDVCYSSLLDALKAAVGTLPNSLAVFDYMRSIFDSYINPTNDPNVQPLVKGLDANDFSMDKFFGLQDPTSLDDVQASLDFEEDLRTNERLRLRVEIHNDIAMLGHLDSFRGPHAQEAIFHVLRTVLCLTMPIHPALVQTGIMNVEQQQDGHSCGKHVLQMLIGAGKKESKGLDRCFREEGLRYIATLEQVQSFDVLFPMYLFGKLPSPPM
ncbi:hypothetical protein R1flu_011264 [Riccia fluitans]|uniref:Uncharacterized protein n=1 Tax=Riccia fluitans TaxID=41844 RepID=A0ABD1Z7C0_9MARC